MDNFLGSVLTSTKLLWESLTDLSANVTKLADLQLQHGQNILRISDQSRQLSELLNKETDLLISACKRIEALGKEIKQLKAN